MNFTGVTLRDMTEEDLKAVYEIETASFSMPWDYEEFETSLKDPLYKYTVAETGEKIPVGYACMFHSLDEGDIASIAVKKEARGQGIGDRLIRSLIDYSKSIGVKKLFLEVRESNTPAISLYEKNGFIRIGIRKDYYLKPVENALTYRAEL